jgi:hypothetical protein
LGKTLEKLNHLFEFNEFKSAPFRFHDYQGRQRTNGEVGNILINCGKEYNKNKRKKTRRNRRRRSEKNEKQKEYFVKKMLRKRREKGKISVVGCPSSVNNKKFYH